MVLFQLPNDMENFLQYKLMGSVKKIRMKPHCIPSRFDCQVGRKHQPSEPRPAFAKRQRMSIIKGIEENLRDKERQIVKASPSVNEGNINSYPLIIILKIPITYNNIEAKL